MTESSSRIICRKRFKILNTLIFVGLGLTLIFLSLITLLKSDLMNVAIEKSLPSWWFIFILGLLLHLVSSLDIVIFEAGIEVSILRRNFFVTWDQVVQVKRYKYYAIFEVEKLTPLNRVVGILIGWTLKPSFSIAGNYTHYVDAMEFVKSRLGSRFVAC